MTPHLRPKAAALVLPALLAFSILASSLPAQVPTARVEDQIRRVESLRREEGLLSQWQITEERERTFEWGGWNSYSLVSFTDDDNDRTTPDVIEDLLIADTRLWGRVTYESGTQLYLRVRHLNFDFDMAPGVAQPKLSNEGLDFDLGYLDFDLKGTSTRMGRQYIRVGHGITFNGNLDALAFSRVEGPWTYKLWAGRSTPNEPDLDPNVRRPRRVYTGLELSYLTRNNTRLYGYYVKQNDSSKQPAGVALPARFHYDSDYRGFGLEGRFNPDLSYSAEGIVEGGTSLLAGNSAVKNDIDAWAGIADLTYHPGWKGHPVFKAEYAKGSGDRNRLAGTNLVSTSNGLGDATFAGFGRYEGGTALNPRLSNLQVFRVGASVKPFERRKGHFRNMVVGATYSNYTKDDPLGGISDLQATAASDDVGDAFDLYAGVKIFSDLTFLVSYGQFSPGKAYPAATRDDTENLFLSLTYSF